MKSNRVKIHLLDDSLPGKGYRVVTGYKGFGAVGLIASLHLVRTLKMKRVGLILTKYQPEYVFRDDNGLSFPYEIYASDKNKLVVVVNREIPDERVRDEYVWSLTKFFKEAGMGPLYLIGGLDATYRENENDELRWIATSGYNGPTPPDKMFEKGLLIVGPLALQIMYAEILDVPAIALLPYAQAETPDPAAAAVAISRLNSMLGIEVPTEELLEEAVRIQESLRKLEELVARESQKSVRGEPYM